MSIVVIAIIVVVVAAAVVVKVLGGAEHDELQRQVHHDLDQPNPRGDLR